MKRFVKVSSDVSGGVCARNSLKIDRSSRVRGLKSGVFAKDFSKNAEDWS